MHDLCYNSEAARLAALDLAAPLRQQLERLLRADERSIALPTGGSLVFAAASDAAFEPPPPPTTMVRAAPARVGRAAALDSTLSTRATAFATPAAPGRSS